MMFMVLILYVEGHVLIDGWNSLTFGNIDEIFTNGFLGFRYFFNLENQSNCKQAFTAFRAFNYLNYQHAF